MRKKFKNLQLEDFPGVSDPVKFAEWKSAGISFRKKAGSFSAALNLIFGVIGITLLIQNDFKYGAIQIGIYGGLAGLISVFVGRSFAGDQFKNLSRHLGISNEMVRQVLRGKIAENAVGSSNQHEISKINPKKKITYAGEDTSPNPIIIVLSILFLLAGIYAVWDILFN